LHLFLEYGTPKVKVGTEVGNPQVYYLIIVFYSQHTLSRI
jgi:hypothetical protein